MAKAKELVIVESPSKAKTIEKYLGSDYRVTASMGHLRDLPKSELGVDIEHGFAPKYIAVKEKKELIDELKAASQKAPVVYLATDPDREGEAISWHLKELLNLPDEKAKRVTFNEITKKVVTDSIQHPRSIDQDLVDAQQARRILDRIVGYEISPLLWKKVKRGLSAGRVQSVATRMVVDREEEIRRFESREYWLLDAFLKRSPDEDRFRARFYGVDGKKRELHFDKAIEVMNMNPVGEIRQRGRTIKYYHGCSREVICRCKYFEAEKIQCAGSFEFTVMDESYQILLCVDGCGKLGSEYFKKGQCILLPAGLGRMEIAGQCELIKVRC